MLLLLYHSIGNIHEAARRAAMASSPLHVVVFPWLAFGHMIPFLELSKQLAKRGHAVTFVSTPRNAARLGAVPPELSPRVRVVTLDLPAVEGLPEGAESTADVPPEKHSYSRRRSTASPRRSRASSRPAAARRRLEGSRGRSSSTSCRICFSSSRYAAAANKKIPCAMFLIFPVGLFTFVGPKHENEAHPRTTAEDYMVPPPWIPFPSTLFYRRHEAEWMAAAFRPNASGVSDADRFWQVHHPSCRLIVHRSCPEAEPRLFPLMTELFAKPVMPAGLLLPDDGGDDDPTGAASGDTAFTAAMRWMDEQPSRSVVYVALGSEAPVTAGHVRELALGLELSGVRFLWALRPPSGHDAGELLPDGFERRVARRGAVLTGWVPQVRVLAHAAVGAFVTHCGWGSTVESLFRFGLPLVMLPFVVDQGLIARAVAARGAGRRRGAEGRRRRGVVPRGGRRGGG